MQMEDPHVLIDFAINMPFQMPAHLHLNIPALELPDNFEDMPNEAPLLRRQNAEIDVPGDGPLNVIQMEDDDMSSVATIEDEEIEECVIIEISPGHCITINITGMTQEEIDTMIKEIEDDADDNEFEPVESV
jgi:hypothetical protein